MTEKTPGLNFVQSLVGMVIWAFSFKGPSAMGGSYAQMPTPAHQGRP